MVKASELRIGNILLLGHHDAIVSEIYKVDGEYVLKLKEKELHVAHNISHFKEIPVSEVWLLKFGFSKHHDTHVPGMTTFEKDGFILLENFRLVFPGSEFMGPVVWSIHELQNLYFSLLGQELQQVQ